MSRSPPRTIWWVPRTWRRMRHRSPAVRISPSCWSSGPARSCSSATAWPTAGRRTRCTRRIMISMTKSFHSASNTGCRWCAKNSRWRGELTGPFVAAKPDHSSRRRLSSRPRSATLRPTSTGRKRTDDMDWDHAFAGIKVIDLTGGVAGPSCAMMLAQHGADVIKVETPHAGGDWSRILGRTYQDHSAFSVYGTLGKRSVAVDLKTPEGQAILWRLIEGADVFMEG